MIRFFPNDWFKTASGLTAGSTAIFCGALVGIHAWLTWGNPVTKTYHLDFSGARWICPTTDGDTGYFRKRIYLPNNVKHAYVLLAATDKYAAYINGTLLQIPTPPGEESDLVTAAFVSAEPATQFDITPYLIRGQNTLTIYVHRRICTRGPDLLVKGCVTDTTGQTQWIYSDDSWRAKTQPDDLVGEKTWTIPSLDDTTWPLARVTSRAVPGWFVQPVDVPPVVLQSPMEGSWISPLEVSAPQVRFHRDFSVPWATDSTWLVMGATGNYRIYLNGDLVAISSQVLYAQPSFALASIDLRPWLKWGANRLEIEAEDAPAENAILANICFVRNDGSMRVLPTDKSWQVRTIPYALLEAQWSAARELARYGDAPYGYRMKLGCQPFLLPGEVARRQSVGMMAGLLVLAVWMWIWFWFSKHLAHQRNIPLDKALTIDALAQVPVGVSVIFLVLVSLDVRFRPDLPFHLPVFLGLLAFSAFLRWRLWVSAPSNSGQKVDHFPVTRQFIRDYGFGIALAIIVAAAFVLRVSNLMNFPLDHDEIFMRRVTHGIVERGYPSLVVGKTVYTLTTYELVPWPEAFCAILTGWPDWSLRVPALLFGTAVCGLIGLFGARLFNRRTGILAALIYAFMAFDVQWARHCFHLQQTQFFAFLCFYAYYESICRGGGVDRRYFPAACILACLTYLSWEGSGFILPSLAILMIALNPTDWRWLRQFHFWAWLAFTCSVVLIQLCNRAMVLPLDLSMGAGLNDIVSPSLEFLDQRNYTLFYYYHLMMMESQAILSVLAIIGLPLFWKKKVFRYVLLLFFLLIMCESGLLPVFSIRYGYYYQPLLVLGGCAVLMEVYDRIAALSRTVLESDWAWLGSWSRGSVMAVVVVTFLAATETGVRLYRMVKFEAEPVSFSRYNDSYYDYETPAKYIRQHIKPGDTVIALMPDPFAHFSGGLTATECNPDLIRRVIFSPSFNPPGYVDSHSDMLVLRDMIQLQDMYYRHNRVWFIAEPSALFLETDKDASSFVKSISRNVYENESGVVYLWDGGGNPAAPLPPTAIQAGPYGATPVPQPLPPSITTPVMPIMMTSSSSKLNTPTSSSMTTSQPLQNGAAEPSPSAAAISPTWKGL